jgi:hypothetical protein
MRGPTIWCNKTSTPVSNKGMRFAEQNGRRRLEEEQLWKLENGYLWISAVSKRLVHYKLPKQPQQRAVHRRLAGFKEIEQYLKEHGAILMNGVASRDATAT